MKSNRIISFVALMSSMVVFSKACSCSTGKSCDQLYDDNWEQLYSIFTASGPWADLVSLDNSKGSGDATYSVNYYVGYSKTASVSMEQTWSAEAGADFADFAASGGYSETVSTLDSQTWSTAISQTFSITVPAGMSTRFWQRKVQFDLNSGEKVCILLDKDLQFSVCAEAQGKNLIYTGILMGCESTCKICSYSSATTSQKLSFMTTCYSSQPDEAARNEFCPIPGIDTPPQQQQVVTSTALRGESNMRRSQKLIVTRENDTFYVKNNQGETMFVIAQ